MDDEETEWAPILAFDSDEPEFTRGFEVGALWEASAHGSVDRTVHAANAEMVMRIAEARGATFQAEDLNDEFVHVVLGEPTRVP